MEGPEWVSVPPVKMVGPQAQRTLAALLPSGSYLDLLPSGGIGGGLCLRVWSSWLN